ncbi:MAG: hypothetical protein MJ187_02610 [Alphaproteobacteria bacterium]|nr:hypothetical protein [Alphaproteobacteria bacterium]
MPNIEETRKQEAESAYQHLLAIRKIVVYKQMRGGADAAMAELFVNGFFQFSFTYGLQAFNCGDIADFLQNFEQTSIIKENLNKFTSHEENRDIVRHLIELRNIRNTKCARCNSIMGCQGCSLSGRENFNIASGLKLMMLCDWTAVYEVLGIPGYFDETDEFVYKLQDSLEQNAQIKMANPDYETDY